MDAYIYTQVEKEQLEEMLESFYHCINLPVEILDESGHVLKRYGERAAYCTNFVSHLTSKNACREVHASAGKRAMDLGESYIFSCHSNLSHIVFPLFNQNHLLGSILIGPFLMEKPDSTLIMDVGKQYPDFSLENLMELYDDSQEVPVVEPSQVTQISKLLFYLMSNLITDAREQLIINRKKLHQQARINESIQMYKNQMPSSMPEYPLEKEQELLSKVREGNLEASSALLNELLGYVFLAAGNSVDVVKYRALELCSLLSRAAIENGAAANEIFKLNNNFIQHLPLFTSIEELCYALIEILGAFMDCMFPKTNESNRAVREAMNFISVHFAEPLTLNDVAEHLHLNPSYFSRLFKQAFGSSFKEYLTRVRIEEAKRLLQNTNYPLLDIAIAVGFDNQSYFTKVFKKQTGITPKQFRS